MAQDGTGSRHSLRATDTEAERWVLAAAINGGSRAVADAVEAGLRADDFGVERLGLMWKAIERLHERGDVIDLLTTVEELSAMGELDNAGGSAAVAAIHATTATPAAIVRHARHVMENAGYRRIAEIAYLIGKSAEERDGPSAEILAEAQHAFLNVNSHLDGGLRIADRKAVVERVMSRSTGKVDGAIPTGIAGLDAAFRGGYRPGGLYVVAARPGMGKSALGHQSARHVSDLGIPAAFFSMEMSDEELIEREIAGDSGVAVDEWFERREVSPKVLDGAHRAASRNLMLIDRGFDLTGLTAAIRRLVRRDGAAIVFIDYLQLVVGSSRWSGSANKNNEVGEISMTLKRLAMDLKIPIVALSQLSRKVEERTDKRPQLSDLRDSGSIEQDANVVLLMFRPDYYEKDPAKLAGREGICEVQIAKNRAGQTGRVNLMFNGPTTSFAECEVDDEGRFLKFL